MKTTKTDYREFLEVYLKERPMFLSLIRAKEAVLFQKYLPLKKPVLDIGVGDGFFAKTVFRSVDYGIDIPGSRMRQAGNLGVYKELLTYDGVHIPLPDKSIKTVVSNCVLEHVSDIGGLVKEIYRVLTPGGRFITTVMVAPWEDYLFGARIFKDAYKKWMRKKQVHVNVFSYNQWEKLFNRTDFAVKESVGYLTPDACALIDVSHYLSVPSLISHIFFRRWVVLPPILPLPKKSLLQILTKNTDVKNSGAVFYVLQKK